MDSSVYFFNLTLQTFYKPSSVKSLIYKQFKILSHFV